LALLAFKNVWKFYGTKAVLKDFNLEIEEGEVVRLEGPNGSGKTTVLKLASGVERPSRGEVRVGGFKPWQPEGKRLFGTVMHFNMTYSDLTVKENLEFFSKLYKADLKYAVELAEAVGFGDKMDVRAGELSFGWRKRLELVRALLHKPKLLLLDEPFVGLDEKGLKDILRILRESNEMGVSIIYTAPSGVGHAVREGERVINLALVNQN